MNDVFLEATAAYHREMPPEPIDRDAAIAAQTAMYAVWVRGLLVSPAEMLTKHEAAIRDDVLAYLHGAIGDDTLAMMTRIVLDVGYDLQDVFLYHVESAIEYQARKLATVEVEKSEYDAQH